MYKKILFVITLLLISVSYAQELPITITKNENTAKSKSSISFKTYTNAVESYFSDKDISKKGSGYKPFKRWEYHWENYLQEDGTIAPAKYLWEAWEQKQKMSKAALAVSNWTDKGPFSQSSNSGQGRINTILVDPNNANTIYIGAPAGGLWKSTDGGVQWTPLTDNLPQIGVSGIAIDPNNSNIIYISTGDDDAGDSFSIGVLKSTDGGATWNQTANLTDSPTSSNEIVIDPTDSNKVWVATNKGLFLSSDAGTSWTRKQVGSIKDFKLKSGDPNTIYAVSNSTFYASTDGGVNFTSTATGLPLANTIGRLRVEVTPAAVNNVYILVTKPGGDGYAFKGIYISNDSGSTFIKTNQTTDIFNSSQAWYDLAFSVSPTNENMIFVGVLDIWRSANGGDNFTKINNWATQTASYTHADIHFMRFYNGALFAGTDGGIYKSTNNGASFTDLTKNLSISQFYKISVSKNNSNSLSGGLQDNGGFSLNNNTWHNFHGGDGMDSAADPNQENTFYGFSQFGGGLSRTTNGGVSSLFIAGAPAAETGPNDDGGGWVTPLVSSKGSEIYAGFSQLYKLENDIWNKVSNHNFGGDLDAIEIDPSNSNTIFVSQARDLFKSTDKGATFTKISSQGDFVGNNISSIEVHHTNSDVIWVTTTGSGNSQFPSSGYIGGRVYKSTNGGQAFIEITDNLPNEAKFVIRHHPYSANNSIYVGTALGVYYRDDTTNGWEVFSTNLPNVTITDLEINPFDNTITAATYGRSVWQSPIPEVTFPAVDVDLLSIVSPQSTVLSCAGDISPKLRIFNNGKNTITALTVNYTVDNGANQTFNWTGSLTPNGTTEVDLPTISSLAEGSHSISSEIVVQNDENTFNNISQNTFDLTINESGAAQAINAFDDPIQDKWIVSDDNLWQIGQPTTNVLGSVVASGYITNPSSNYSDLTVSFLTSPCYKLSNLENPILKFKMAFDLEPDWDIVYVEYSIDQGTSWLILGTANDPNWYNSSRTPQTNGQDCFNCVGAQWTGTDATLKEYSYNLAALNNETSIMFRFKFVSDQSVNLEGVVIDDFVVDATAILAVNDFEKGAFSIYPNPSSDIFNIRRSIGLGEEMNINVFDITGKTIKQQFKITDTNYQLDMQGVTKGIYFMKLSIGGKQLVKKLILK